MKQTIRMIGFDLDDTLFNSRKEVTPRVAAAIHQAAAAGIVVLPATGRALSGIPASVLDLPIQYALTSNGAQIFRLPDRSILRSNCFSQESARLLLELSREFDCYPSVYINGEAFSQPENMERLRSLVSPQVYEYLLTSRIPVPSLDDLLRHSPDPVEKLTLYFADQQERMRARRRFEQREDTSVTSSLPYNLEINTASANKGTALLALAGSLGIAQQQVMAIGDSDNDIEMLKAVGYGVAMGNAQPAVKQAADYTTLGCDEDGVAAAIEMLLQSKQAGPAR